MTGLCHMMPFITFEQQCWNSDKIHWSFCKMVKEQDCINLPGCQTGENGGCLTLDSIKVVKGL